MKLILCRKCHDLVAMRRTPRRCECGAAGGQYVDDVNAVYHGEAVPLGIANSSLATAVQNQPEDGNLGQRFEAFVIQKTCPTFTRER
jgi:hypothetical protein